MKQTVALKALAFIVALALASYPSVVTAQDATDRCAMIGNIAENVMRARQNNATLSETIATMTGVVENQAAKDAVKALIIAAYGRPAFSTAENQAKAVKQFRNDIELQCYGS